MSHRVRSGLPLAAWASLLGGGAVLAVATGVALVLRNSKSLDALALEALSVGSFAGLLVVLVGALAAVRLAAALRALNAPVSGIRTHTLIRRASLEVGDLVSTLDGLYLRVRVADELGQRHRRDAETTSAGVFELLSGLVEAEEGARGQLAAELHDTVAQSLMLARGLLTSGEPTPAEILTLRDCVEDAEEQVRAILARTRPPALRDGDLASAVDGLSLDMLTRYGLRVVLQWPESPYPLPLASAVTVYRFFQEGLLNVIKHADVDDVVLSLRVEQEAVFAQVRDEGMGFDPTVVRSDRGRHVGLSLLRERARLSGGALVTDSQDGEGTTLTLRLPRPGAVVAGAGLPVGDPNAAHPAPDAPRLRRLSDR